MHVTYLCPKHADWVFSNPDQAAYFLARDELQGSLLLQSGHYTHAIPYLGCAFDIAAILLELEEQNKYSLINTVKSLALQLTMAYQSVQEQALVDAINRRATLLLKAATTTAQDVLQAP